MTPTLLPTLPTITVTDTRLRLPIGQLHAHPAQMRTVYSIPGMAELALQVLTSGVDPWNPIVATPAPAGNGYYVVSGHRRRMATLFGWAVDLWLSRHPDRNASRSTFTLEQMTDFITTLTTKYQDVEKAAEALAAQFTEHEIEVALFNGDEKAQILALQRANYGAETPDPLGIAHSLQAALEAGATETAIARNLGQPLSFVQKHLALTRVPIELADLIATGKLPMSIAKIVADVHPESARNGMALFVVTNTAQITAETLKNCAHALKNWHQFATMPMSVTHQGQRNMIRILTALWTQQVAAKPLQTWATAVMLVYKGVNHIAPWEDQNAYSHWIQSLGGDAYYEASSGIQWEALVGDLLTVVACDTCPIAQLPERLLQQDLTDRLGTLGRPCRTSQRAAYTRCINGFTPTDGVEVRVPFEWAAHPGIVKLGQFYSAGDMAALQQAWSAQAALEDAETTPPLATEATLRLPSQPLAVSATSSAITTPTSPNSSVSQDTTLVDITNSPIAKMRTQISAYMATHSTQMVLHPLATPCTGCQHHLTQSPTKDPSVPRCAWAGRLRTVQFFNLTDTSGQISVPVCRQYAPNRPWQALIPAHAHPFTLPREYLLNQIRLHVKAADRAMNTDRHPFEFLTGRPMSTDSHKDWFESQFSEQVGTLSDAQLSTLFVWSLSEYERAQSAQGFTVPRDGTMSSFIYVSEIRSFP